MNDIKKIDAETLRKQCAELAEILNALLGDYVNVVFDEPDLIPLGNMVRARELLNELADGDKPGDKQKNNERMRYE